jgi:predicted CXXCH cytochrome family protein
MSKKKNSYLIYYISVIIIVIFFGCSVEQTHNTLTFFFDGVPPLYKLLVKTDSVSNSAVAAKVAARKKPDMYFHKPYLERKCEQCHTPDRHLIMPQPALCYQCHTNFTETYKYVHGPVASGNCTKCHNQHNSQYPKLLSREGQQVCLYCHSTSLVFNNKYHRKIEDAECTLCHNPHGGKTRFMIKESVARDFNGLALLNDVASRHLFARIYCNTPGDIKRGTEIITQENDKNFETIATSYTDANGTFGIDNVRPTSTYTFKTKSEIPDNAKMYITDYKDQVLYIIEKNRKGKFVFDKNDFASSYAIAKANQRNDSLKEIGLAPQKIPAAATDRISANVMRDKKITDSLAPDITGVVKKIETEPAPANTTEKVADVPTIQPAGIKKPVDRTKTDTVADENAGKVTGTNPTAVTPIQLPVIKDETEVTAVKLAGRTYHFTKGTVVGILNDDGDMVAVAKIDDKGNFVLDKISNYTLGGPDTGIYSKIVLLYYNMEPAVKRNTGALNTGFTDVGTNPTANNRLFSVAFYDFGKYNLRPEGITELNKLVKFLGKNGAAKISVVAHTDARGSAAYNLMLSDKRAKAAKDYLVSQGILPKRITAKGMGKSQLKNKCSDGVPCSEEEHQENRRVEISIIVK